MADTTLTAYDAANEHERLMATNVDTAYAKWEAAQAAVLEAIDVYDAAMCERGVSFDSVGRGSLERMKNEVQGY